MTTTQARLDGRAIALAHYSTRAVLDRELSRLGTSFAHSSTLNVLAEKGGSSPRGALVRHLARALKIEEQVAERTMAELRSAGLLALTDDSGATGPQLRLTEKGGALQQRVAAAVATLNGHLFHDLAPDEQLAQAAGILTRLKERADALLEG